MRAFHYYFAHSLSDLLHLLLLLLAIAAQVRARPLLAERLRMTIEDYGRSLRPLPPQHAASPPVIRPCKEMPATVVTMTAINDSDDEIMGATYSPPSPSPKVSPPTHQITCSNSPPINGDLIISMVADIDFEAPSKSPPPPPKVSPPSKQVKDDLEARSRPPPPPPKGATPQIPGIEDFKAPSRSPPPSPKVAPPSQHINNSERTYKSPPPSQNSSPSTHQLTEESGQLIMINFKRSLPYAESYY